MGSKSGYTSFESAWGAEPGSAPIPSEQLMPQKMPQLPSPAPAASQVMYPKGMQPMPQEHIQHLTENYELERQYQIAKHQKSQVAKEAASSISPEVKHLLRAVIQECRRNQQMLQKLQDAKRGPSVTEIILIVLLLIFIGLAIFLLQSCRKLNEKVRRIIHPFQQ